MAHRSVDWTARGGDCDGAALASSVDWTMRDVMSHVKNRLNVSSFAER